MAPPDAPDKSGGPTAENVDLATVVLADARTGEPFDLVAGHPIVVLAVIRHRY